MSYIDMSRECSFFLESSADEPLKFNIDPENRPSQLERIVFQPPFFRGKLAVKLRCCISKFPKKVPLVRHSDV